MSGSGRHVAITGASSGIGEALARAFAARGDRLTLVARRRELLEGLNAKCGGQAHLAVQDLADPSKATDWLGPAQEKHGPIDVLVNNAGMENLGLTSLSDVAEGQKLLNLNLVTPLLITRALLPSMLERKAGVVVQISSVAGIVSMPGQSWYGASKSGLAQFNETLRLELKGTGVNALTVYPGPVKTAMGDAAFAKYGGREGPAGKAPEGTPDVLAALILRAIDRRSARVIYPGFYWLTWLNPWLARFIVAHTGVVPKVQ